LVRPFDAGKTRIHACSHRMAVPQSDETENDHEE